MYLVDTSVWINHFCEADPALIAALDGELVVSHTNIIGEIALGSLKDRALILTMMRDLPALPSAEDIEVQQMIESQRLYGRGIGYIDAHLLAAALIDATVRLWTADKRLARVAEEFGIVGAFELDAL